MGRRRTKSRRSHLRSIITMSLLQSTYFTSTPLEPLLSQPPLTLPHSLLIILYHLHPAPQLLSKFLNNSTRPIRERGDDDHACYAGFG